MQAAIDRFWTKVKRGHPNECWPWLVLIVVRAMAIFVGMGKVLRLMARSEKEALLEQYAILSNSLPKSTPIRLVFATAYNRYGEGKPWRQERVRQFFANDELLVGGDFWNFMCRLPNGYDLVLAAYRDCVPEIRAALESIRGKYLGVTDA